VQGEIERCICRLTGENVVREVASGTGSGKRGDGAKSAAVSSSSVATTNDNSESVSNGGTAGGGDKAALGIRVVFAARTDKGVHARGQVALVRSCSELAWTNPAAFAKRLSSFLPEDVAVVHAAHAEAGFDPRKGSIGKWYRYTIACGSTPPALGRHMHWFVPRPRNQLPAQPPGDKKFDVASYLDVEEMQRAANQLAGQPLDMTSFANVGKGSASDGMDSSARDPICTIETVCVCRSHFGTVEVDIRGSRFLYNMVRIIVGTLVEVGLGRTSAGDIAGIVCAKDRKAAGPGAPAKGLCLMEVFY
jgi:tRNA pseudouridine38-40 synthase